MEPWAVHSGLSHLVAMSFPLLSDSKNMEVTSSTLFLLTHPMNDFGGYTLTYPKGTIDKGESLEHTAVREVYEETGLSVKPVALLGDFKGRDSITRFFVGYITGGSPTDAGKETDAVTFKPVPEDYQKQAWYGELRSRDRKERNRKSQESIRPHLQEHAGQNH